MTHFRLYMCCHLLYQLVLIDHDVTPEPPPPPPIPATALRIMDTSHVD